MIIKRTDKVTGVGKVNFPKMSVQKTILGTFVVKFLAYLPLLGQEF